MSILSYQDLEVWKLGMLIAVESYRVTIPFPKAELFGMTSQIRRASASVPANIAEGYGRDNKGHYLQSLRIANGSLKELETHLLLAERVGLVRQADIDDLLSHIDRQGRMLRGLMRSIDA